MRMLVWLCACVRVALAVLAALVAHSAIATAETAPVDFAREYIREIVVNEHMTPNCWPNSRPPANMAASW